MKKLLTVLLTLVMAVCLVNFNNSHSKAEEGNATYDITCAAGTWSGLPGSDFNEGDILNISATTSNATLVDEYGVSHNVAVGSPITYTIEHDNTSFTPEASKLTLSNPKVIQCDGLKYDTDGEWYDGTAVLETAQKLAKFGIVKVSDGVYNFTKELTITTNANARTVEIKKDLTINLTANINIVNSYTSGKLACISHNSHKLTINGNNNSLTMYEYNDATGPSFLGTGTGSSTTLNNVNLIAKRRVGGTSVKVSFAVKTLVLNNSTIKVTNDINNGAALSIMDEPSQDIKDKYDILGKAELTDTKLKATTRNITNGAYQVQSDDTDELVYAKYIEIVPKQPEPTPSPSEPVVKDESCEKVIGPTWHWNNDKGICEDYGVVGTSTR